MVRPDGLSHDPVAIRVSCLLTTGALNGARVSLSGEEVCRSCLVRRTFRRYHPRSDKDDKKNSTGGNQSRIKREMEAKGEMKHIPTHENTLKIISDSTVGSANTFKIFNFFFKSKRTCDFINLILIYAFH